ncbi:IS3 family transposase [Corynebacterium guaraldiae]|uniref:IS3 family transposase n=4 Tax=Corynebacterium TaxID=1716 RepID=A0ABY3CSZ5_9CORY|nr:IS3 family transposase [Corynebacterium guaraldiae]TRX48416.1 IS3 family transposase [Corynebacterium guaraldiae]
MPRKYSAEFKEKAVHQVLEMVRLESCSRQRAYEEVGELLGVSHHTLRAWYRDSVAHEQAAPTGGETMEEELKRLRRENRELKRANGILKTASGFFRSGARPTHDQMISYIDEHKEQFGAWAICRVLKQADRGFITSRGYRKAITRAPSARALSDSLLIPEIQRVHAENFSVYGIRKMWHAMNREGFHIGRDKTARLMKLAGVSGRRRGRTPVTTISPKVPDHRPDLVQRNSRATAPGRLWVADITYVRTLSGFAYTAFVIDVYSRKIVGVATRSTMRTDALPMEALEHALTTAGRIHGDQLIHHSDRGSQYVSLKYSTALAEAEIRPSVGTVGDSYDNALAETVNGLYKAELIHPQGPWTSVGEVELATLRWVHWWNTKRLHEALDYATPQEVETEYYLTEPINTGP